MRPRSRRETSRTRTTAGAALVFRTVARQLSSLSGHASIGCEQTSITPPAAGRLPGAGGRSRISVEAACDDGNGGAVRDDEVNPIGIDRVHSERKRGAGRSGRQGERPFDRRPCWGSGEGEGGEKRREEHHRPGYGPSAPKGP